MEAKAKNDQVGPEFNKILRAIFNLKTGEKIEFKSKCQKFSRSSEIQDRVLVLSSVFFYLLSE